MTNKGYPFFNNNKHLFFILFIAALFISVPFFTYADDTDGAPEENAHDATQIWLDELDDLSRRLQNNGFVYGSSVKSTYEVSLHSNKQVNCGGYVGWALKELGLFDQDKSFYSRGYFENHPGTFTVITVNKTPSQLRDVLQPGDIVRYETMGHHHVFAGWNSSGTPLWYGLGRGMMWTRNVPLGYYSNRKIYQIIRINQYAVDATVEGGTIDGYGTYFPYEDVHISYKPDMGYELKSVVIDGTEYNTSEDVFDKDIYMDGLSGNHSVEIKFVPAKDSEAEVPNAEVTASALTSVNYRNGPGMRFDKVGEFKSGDEVTVVSEVTAIDGAKWYKMKSSSGDEIVYALASCFDAEDEVSEGKSSVTGMLNDNADFKVDSSIDADTIYSLDENSKVNITGAIKTDGDIWYRVKSGNKVGYILGSKVNIISESA